MEPVVADLNPKTIENAKRQFEEVYGSAVVMPNGSFSATLAGS